MRHVLAAARAKLHEQLKLIAIYGLVFAAPIAIGLATGHAAWMLSQRTQLESDITKNGIPVEVRIDRAHVWRDGDPPLSQEHADRRYRVCYLDVSYNQPGSTNVIRKVITPFESLGADLPNILASKQPHCGSFKSGGSLTGKVLPNRPTALFLDNANRASQARLNFLFWISIILTGVPASLLVIGGLQSLFIVNSRSDKFDTSTRK